jgi:hypothetical protein
MLILFRQAYLSQNQEIFNVTNWKEQPEQNSRPVNKINKSHELINGSNQSIHRGMVQSAMPSSGPCCARLAWASAYQSKMCMHGLPWWAKKRRSHCRKKILSSDYNSSVSTWMPPAMGTQTTEKLRAHVRCSDDMITLSSNSPGTWEFLMLVHATTN